MTHCQEQRIPKRTIFAKIPRHGHFDRISLWHSLLLLGPPVEAGERQRRRPKTGRPLEAGVSKVGPSVETPHMAERLRFGQTHQQATETQAQAYRSCRPSCHGACHRCRQTKSAVQIHRNARMRCSFSKILCSSTKPRLVATHQTLRTCTSRCLRHSTRGKSTPSPVAALHFACLERPDLDTTPICWPWLWTRNAPYSCAVSSGGLAYAATFLNHAFGACKPTKRHSCLCSTGVRPALSIPAERYEDPQTFKQHEALDLTSI